MLEITIGGRFRLNSVGRRRCLATLDPDIVIMEPARSAS